MLFYRSMRNNIIIATCCSLAIIFGTLGALNNKYQYLTKANGLPDSKGNTLRNFEHPWLQVLLMFWGELLCLAVYFAILFCKAYILPEGEDITTSWESNPVVDTIFLRYPRLFMAIPALCDMINSGLIGLGLLYLDSSVTQMLRGSNIIFIGILTKIVFKRSQSWFKWSGIFITSIGIIIVGSSFILRAYNSSGSGADTVSTQSTIFGVGLIILSQSIFAVQSIIEEYFMKSIKLAPLEAIGYEGLFGSIFTTILLLILYYVPGKALPDLRVEDTLDAIKMLKNSQLLVGLVVSYIFIIFVFNYTMMVITKKLSAVHKSIIMALRSLLIWLVEIFVYYALKNEIYGRPIDSCSLIEIDGFALLVLGAVIYNKY